MDIQNYKLACCFFFFFFLGPVCISSGSTAAFKAYCAWPVVLYGCETWSLTLREECRLRVFQNTVLWIGPKRDEVTGSVENYIIRSLIICTPH
jgi:hypothetical protein